MHSNLTNTTNMSQQQRQSALQNIPRVVVRPAWNNAIAVLYLPKVRMHRQHTDPVLTGNRVSTSSSHTRTSTPCSRPVFCLPSC